MSKKVTLMHVDANVMATVNRIEEIIFAEDDIRKTLTKTQNKLEDQIEEKWEELRKSEPERQNPTPEIDELQRQVDAIQKKKESLGRYLRLTLFGQKKTKKQERVEGLYESILTVNGTPLYSEYEEGVNKRSFKAFDEAIKVLISETWNTGNISEQAMAKFCKWVSRASTGVQRAKGHTNIQNGTHIKKKTEKAFYEDLFAILVDAMGGRNADLVIPLGKTHEGQVGFEKETLKVLSLTAVQKDAE